MTRSLREEIQQSRPFASRATEVALGLLRTNDLFAAATAALLRPHGLTQSSYNVLRILRGAGDEGLPCAQIGQRMVSRVPDVTRLVDRLVERGLVDRQRSESDRRVVWIRLLPTGRELLAELDQPIEDLNRQLCSGLDDGQLARLIGLLDTLRAGVD